jgi:SAM-dependent methyltransferase
MPVDVPRRKGARILPRIGSCVRQGRDLRLALAMGYYAVLRTVYRTAFPEPWRLALATADPGSSVHRFAGPIKHLLQHFALQEELYDRSFHEETVAWPARKSAPAMARSIRETFAPGSVVDVGCGTGELLHALRGVGVPGTGFEYSEASLAVARARALKVVKLDLERPLHTLPVGRADLAIATQVADHLPERCADGFVAYLCQAADTVLITAAQPGQGGSGPVNEQPNAYWIAKFEERGFGCLRATSLRLRREWEAEGVADFYANGVLVFRKTGPRANRP